MLTTDGSSSKRRAGVGISLTPPGGTPMTYAILLPPYMTNNEAEYGTLIIDRTMERDQDSSS